MWLPSSSDVNPVDYKVWRTTQQRSDNDVSELRQWLTEIKHGLQQTVIDEATNEWHERP